MFRTLSLDIDDTSHIATARQAASEMALDLGFNEQDTGRAALLATEAAAHLLSHAGRGELLLSIRDGSPHDLVLTALDQGPGFSTEQALADDASTTASVGGRLRAMKQVASELHLYSRHGRGNVARMVLRRTGQPPVRPDPAASLIEVAGVERPCPGETICGDAWMYHDDGHSLIITVADGLGHGIEARKASAPAVDPALALNPSAEPGQPAHRRPHEVVSHAHGALRGTRGAALATARIDPAQRTLSYAGIGNIAGIVVTRSGQKHLLSLPGIVGHNVRKIQAQEQAWPDDALLIMHSDGLGTHWRLQDDPMLFDQPPCVIAAVLYRDHRRGRDDITVVVAKWRASA